MQTVSLKLVTIVAEPVLEERLKQELRSLGAHGWTVTEGRGEGSRGIHAAELPGTVIRVEVVVGPDVAQKILEHVAATYFARYAVIAFVSDVQVVRGDKYA